MKRTFLTFPVIALLFCGTLVMAFSSGPPDGRTGGPGESNCTVACHSSFALNSGPGTLVLTAPPNYSPNDTLTISVALSQTGQLRWGFEVTVLDTNDAPVGAMVVTDAPRTQISTDITTMREYIKHTSTGTDNGTPDTAPGWSFDWIAPVSDVGPVTFYIAGNAANGNLFNTGDYIYTTSTTVNPLPVACCIGIRGNVDNDGLDAIDIADLVYLVAFAFGGGPAPVCTEEADIDASGGAIPIDIADIVYLVNFMFGGGPAPVIC